MYCLVRQYDVPNVVLSCLYPKDCYYTTNQTFSFKTVYSYKLQLTLKR